MRASLPLLLLLPAAALDPPGGFVTVLNRLPLARPNETVELDAAALRRLLAVDDVRKVHVRAEGSNKDLLVQAVDSHDDGVFEQLLFQADFAPYQTRVFMLTAGERQIARASDYKTYGRLVRGRRDDFAWENDRIAHRMHGKELATLARDKLISSAVEVWTRRVRTLMPDNWHVADDSLKDSGEGGDFYSAGATRGDGGTAVWAGGKPYVSANFRDSKVYAVGPIRVLFELTYDAWDAGGVKIKETKRVSLDAGQNLDRFESRYTFAGDPAALRHAIGIRKQKTIELSVARDRGILRTWEPLKEGGELGQAIVVDPAVLADQKEDHLNYYLLTRIAAGKPCVSYSGFAWTGSGDFKTAGGWDRYLADFAARLGSPLLEVKLAGR